MSPKCSECGLGYSANHAPDVRYHRTVHDRAVNGPKTQLSDGYYAITHQSPIGIQRLAQAAASAALYETRYDITSFYGVKKRFDEFKTIAVICVSNGRVVGLLVSRERHCKYTTDLDSFQADHFGSWRPTNAKDVESHKRRAVDMIWVLKGKRRQGIARGLINSVAKHCDMRIEDIAHMLPFRIDALKLWMGLKLSTIYIV